MSPFWNIIIQLILIMNFRKTPCAYHQTQFITNFCAEKQCLLPLCPTCISGHTQAHRERSSFPRFQNIEESCARASRTIDQQTSEFLYLKQQFSKIASKKENSSKDILNILTQTKRNIIYKIENLFDDLIQETLVAVEGKEKEIGLLSNTKTYEMKGVIDSQLSQLSQIKLNMEGEESLGYLVKFLSTEVDAKSALLKDLEREIKFNQEYHAGIQIIEDIVPQIQSVIRGGIRIKFVLPTQETKVIAGQPFFRQPLHTITRTPSSILDQSRNTVLSKQKSYNQVPFRRSIEFVTTPSVLNPHIIRPSSSYIRNSVPTRINTLPLKTIFPFSQSFTKQNHPSPTLKPNQSVSKIKKGLNLHKPSTQTSSK